MSYDRISSHAEMLRDVVRTEAYDRAISEVIKPGQKAIDFGCGTGILSHFCARAGASDVYAIDRSSIIVVARVAAQRNGLENIHFVYGEGDKVELPAKADVLVSEWMGAFLFWERMLEPLIKIRDQYLAEDGVMLPSRMFLKGRLSAMRSCSRRCLFSGSDLIPWTSQLSEIGFSIRRH